MCQKLSQLIAYNMKACLRFYTLIFSVSPNLAKHTYGQSPLEQHHKIEKKNTEQQWFLFSIFVDGFYPEKNLK